MINCDREHLKRALVRKYCNTEALKKTSRITKIIYLGILLCFGWAQAGCSSPTLLEKFREVDGDAKSLFISYYPFLTREQRERMLSEPNYARIFLREWNIPAIESSEIKQKHKLSSVTIAPGGESSIRAGHSIFLRAVAHYTDGKVMDVTDDAQWQVLPDLAEITHPGQLTFGCAHSSVVVTANFFDEVEGKETYKINKPLHSLKIGVADSSASVEESEYIQLKVIAQCEDDTERDVSCQATWDIDPSVGKFLGCGNLHIAARSIRERSAEVSVRYGPKSVLQTVWLPVRSLQRHFSGSLPTKTYMSP
jgi:hypothetical protein